MPPTRPSRRRRAHASLEPAAGQRPKGPGGSPERGAPGRPVWGSSRPLGFGSRGVARSQRTGRGRNQPLAGEGHRVEARIARADHETIRGSSPASRPRALLFWHTLCQNKPAGDLCEGEPHGRRRTRLRGREVRLAAHALRGGPRPRARPRAGAVPRRSLRAHGEQHLLRPLGRWARLLALLPVRRRAGAAFR